MKRLNTYCMLVSAWLCSCSHSALENDGLARVHEALRDASPSARTDVVAVLSRVGGTDAWCTGIVLEPTLVFTAEHCIAAPAPLNTVFDCKSSSLAPVAPQSQAWVAQGTAVNAVSSSFIAVNRVRLPAGASRLCGDDIALLELESPLEGGSVASITQQVPPSHTEFTSVGYGADGALSGNLLENSSAEITCVGEQCADSRIAASEILATSGACEGDSGGPALTNDGRVFAMAVRSRADCGETAYLSFTAHGAWLAQNAAEVANTQGIAVPDWASAILAATESPPPSDADAAVPAKPNTDRQLTAYGGGCSTPRRTAPTSAALTMLLAAGLIVSIRRNKSGK